MYHTSHLIPILLLCSLIGACKTMHYSQDVSLLQAQQGVALKIPDVMQDFKGEDYYPVPQIKGLSTGKKVKKIPILPPGLAKVVAFSTVNQSLV